MKGMLRVRSLLFLLPLMVFFCQKTNSPWGFCVGNNQGIGGENTFAFEFPDGICPEEIPTGGIPVPVL